MTLTRRAELKAGNDLPLPVRFFDFSLDLVKIKPTLHLI